MEKEMTMRISREGNGYVSQCLELDIASQGESVEEALGNLIEAVKLFFKTASQEEILSRMKGEVDTDRPDLEEMS
jgi:predicted RNase H-like HicB family nuclease